VARVALDAGLLIAFLDPGDAQHERAVDELRPRLADGVRFVPADRAIAHRAARLRAVHAAWLAAAWSSRCRELSVMI
jgi:predicted nucleic acid-binding protein